MSKVIRDIWILFQEGTVIFKRVFDEKVDAQLFGGFMSALNAFASQISDKGMSSFDLGDKNFFIHRENNLLFIVNCDKKVNKKDSTKELLSIVKKFFQKYPKTIFEQWDGDIGRFDVFKTEIEESLDFPIQKLKDALW